MSAMQRRKGAGYEREVCDDIFKALGIEVCRNLGQARDGGNDVDLADWLFECKRRHRISVEQWLKQCEAACVKKGKKKAAVWMRADGGESMVLIRGSVFLEIVREAIVRAIREEVV